MLVHGFGEDGRIWDYLGYPPGVKYIIPDLPGSGQSIMEGADWSMDSLAETLKRIIEEEKDQTITLIGHSMGGYIALAFVEKYPELINAFGLFHSSAFPDSDEKITARKKSIQFIESHSQLKFLEQATPNLFSDIFKRNHPEKVDQIINQFTNFQEGALVHYYEAMMQRPDRTHILENAPVPVLFILGEHDTAIPLADGLKQCHLPPLSYIHILKESGHMGMIEETDKCRQILQKFLQDL